MSRNKLTKAVSEQASLTKTDAKRLVDAFFGQIQEALGQGESVVIREFGSFYPTAHDAFGAKAEEILLETGMTSDEPVFKPGKPLMDLFDIESSKTEEDEATDEELDSQALSQLRQWLAIPSEASLSKITSFLEKMDSSLPETSLITEYASSHIKTWPKALTDSLKQHEIDLQYGNKPHVFPSLVENVDFGEICTGDLPSLGTEPPWYKELLSYSNLKEIYISTEGYTTNTTDPLDLDEDDEDYDEKRDELELENEQIRDQVLEHYEEELIAFCEKLKSRIPGIQLIHVEVRARDERCECWFESSKTKRYGQ